MFRFTNKTLLAGSLTLASALMALIAADQTAPAKRTVGQWTTAAPLNSARSGACSALLPDGRLIVTGGTDGHAALASAEALGSSGTFEPVSSMQNPRQDHVCAALPDGTLLVAGGRTDAGPVNAAEIFHPDLNQWTAAPPMSSARAGATATTLKDGRIVIGGGQGAGTPLNTIEIYDPSRGTFSTVGATLTAPRSGHAAATLPDGRVLIAGGTDGAKILDSIDVLDPNTGTVAAFGHLSTPRAGLSATAMYDGDILFAGGNDGMNDLATAEVLNGKTGKIGDLVQMSSARSGHVAISLPHNNSVLFVGGTSAGQEVGVTEAYVPWQHQFQSAGSLGIARTATAVSPTQNLGQLIVMGGQAGRQLRTTQSEASSFATLTSDKTDYSPGQTVHLSGTNWQANETVQITMHVTPTTHPDVILTPQADSKGNITATYVVQQSDLGVTFNVTSLGLKSGKTAAVLIFTDASGPTKLAITSVNGGSNPVYGTSFSVTVQSQNNGGNATNVGANTLVTLTVGPGTVSGTTSGTITNGSSSVTISGVFYSAATAGVTLTAAATGLTSGTAPLVVTAKPLTAQGTLGVNAKTYDGTTAATLTGSASLQASEALTSSTSGDGKPITGDTVSLSGTALGTFVSRNVGSPVSVTISGLSLTGAQSSNYTLTAPTTAANITPKALTQTGLSATDKTYNGNTSVTLSGLAALQGTEAAGAGTTSDGKPYSVDSVSITGTPAATFNSKDVANGVAVNITGLSLTGTGNTNYTLTLSVTANITAKALTAAGNLAGVAKTYDGGATATFTGAAALQATEAAGTGTEVDGKPYSVDGVSLLGTASGTFVSRNVGSPVSITVSGLSLTGTGSGNYTLTAPTASANITAKSLTVTGISANGKVYDHTTSATVTGTAALQSPEDPGTGTTSDGKPYNVDSLTVSGTPTGTFASKDAGNGVTVTIGGLTLSGAGSTNYTVTGTTMANITPKPLTATGTLSAAGKTYDATTSAVLSGAAALLASEGSGPSNDGKPYTGDGVSITGTASGAFASANVGTPVSVTISGLSVSASVPGDYTLSFSVSANITAKTIIESGLSGANKTYDATKTATFSGTAGLLTAEAPGAGTSADLKPYTGDAVSVSGTPSGTFASKDVANGIAITVTGLSLTGGAANNYVLSLPAFSANITAKALTEAGLTGVDKTYNATTAASLTGSAGLLPAEAPGAGLTTDGTPYTGDTVSINGTAAGTFVSKDVANGIVINIGGLSLTGAEANDYSLTAPTTTANITAKALTASGLTGVDKTYDATLTATVSGTAALQAAEAAGGSTADGRPYTGDTVGINNSTTGTFASKDVANGIVVTVTGLSLTGAQSGNYTLTAPTTTANITRKALTESGLTGSPKVYDATTNATLGGTAGLLAAEAPGGPTGDGKPYTGDAVSVTGTATGTFVSKDAANGITINIAGLSLTGGNAGNYSLNPPATTGNITPKPLSETGLTGVDKTYDAGTSASLTGSAGLIAAEAVGAGSTADGTPYNVDTVSIGGTPMGTFTSANAGSPVSITISGLSLGGANASNYSLSTPTTSANINQKGLTVTASSPVVAYGDATPSITASIVGFVGGQNSSALTTQPSCSTAYTNFSNAGSTPSTNCSGAVATNYSFGYTDGFVTVNQAPLSITASSITLPYGSAVPAISPGFSGFKNSENNGVLSAQPICSTTYAGTGAGGFPSSCSSASAANYSIGYVPGMVLINATLTATPGSLRVSLNWKVYANEPTGYQIYKSTNGGPFTLVTTTPAILTPGTATYTVTGLTNGTPYSFYVVAVGLGGITPTVTSTPKGL
jgi:hypothetical protein